MTSHQPDDPGDALTEGLSRLSGSQRTLYEALASKDPRLARMYLGALSVLDRQGNPDRLALASHGLRELMEKMVS